MEGCRSEDGGSTQNSKQHASIIAKQEKRKNGSRYKKDGIRGGEISQDPGTHIGTEYGLYMSGISATALD